jgi:TonB family protein
MATPPPQQMAALTPAQPGGETKFREFREKTQIEGSISNKGRPSVNAVGTPLGRYMRHMSMLIESRWQHLIQRDREWISVGSVRVRFTVMPDGRIGDVTVEANDSSRRHADVCVEAIRETKLEPIPPEVSAALADGKLDIPFTFTLLP